MCACVIYVLCFICRCLCFSGFEVNSDDFRVCDDINECLDVSIIEVELYCCISCCLLSLIIVNYFLFFECMECMTCMSHTVPIGVSKLELSCSCKLAKMVLWFLCVVRDL